jgi:hypothetical protein
MLKHLAFPSAIILAACSPGQLSGFQTGAQKFDSALQIACSDALAVANLAGLIPGVGAIVPYINAGCATADGLAKLAADPSSAAWVGQLTGEVKALASNVGVKL